MAWNRIQHQNAFFHRVNSETYIVGIEYRCDGMIWVTVDFRYTVSFLVRRQFSRELSLLDLTV